MNNYVYTCFHNPTTNIICSPCFINGLHISPPMAYPLLNKAYIMNRKQIDNLSKYCYDISPFVMGLAVVGNLVSDKFSTYTFWIGLIGVCIFLITGFFIDKMEVNNNVKH